jgi:hypothetical protein
MSDCQHHQAAVYDAPLENARIGGLVQAFVRRLFTCDSQFAACIERSVSEIPTAQPTNQQR